jgi:hypothetical protein
MRSLCEYMDPSSLFFDFLAFLHPWNRLWCTMTVKWDLEKLRPVLLFSENWAARMPPVPSGSTMASHLTAPASHSWGSREGVGCDFNRAWMPIVSCQHYGCLTDDIVRCPRKRAPRGSGFFFFFFLQIRWEMIVITDIHRRLPMYQVL